MKYLLLGVHVVIKTNMEISSCCLADYCTSNKFSIKVRAMHAAQLFSLIQPVRSLFSGIVFAVAIVLG